MFTYDLPGLVRDLRTAADLLDTLTVSAKLDARLTLTVPDDLYAPADLAEPGRVALVDAIAARLGLPTGDSEYYTGGPWLRRGRARQANGLYLDVKTPITRPVRCGCGATCTHPTTAPASPASVVAA